MPTARRTDRATRARRQLWQRARRSACPGGASASRAAVAGSRRRRLTSPRRRAPAPGSADGGSPRSASVPISASSACADRSSGSATSAPVPSPSRMPRSTSGSRPRASSARCCAGSVERCPASHQSAASVGDPARDERARARDDAVEQHRGAPGRGLHQEARSSRRCRRCRRVRSSVQRGRLADRGRRRGRARRAARRPCAPRRRRRSRCRCRRPRAAAAPRQAATSAAATVRVADAHVAGDQQVGAGVDLLVGDRACPRANAALDLVVASGRPRRSIAAGRRGAP